jgi:hypothetical protein
MRITLKALVVAIVTMAVVTGGAFGAKKLIINGGNVKNSSLTGSDIKNGSITNSDIRKGTVKLDKLSSGTQKLIRAVGKTGPQGPQGPAGGPGSGVTGPNWSIIARNQIGSPAVQLVNGPIVGAAANQKPPYGSGSLSLSVGNPTGATEKAAFGDQSDFGGQTLASITQLGFRVFTVQENEDIAARNLPNIATEVDPTGDAATPAGSTLDYSTLVWNPPAIPSSSFNHWSGYLDATNSGDFYFTGQAGAKNPDGTANTACSQATPCTLTQAKAKFPSAKISLSLGVTKGRDNAFNGNVDGLRVNNNVYDFESYGVVTRAP